MVAVKEAVCAEPTSAAAQFTLGRVFAARGDLRGAETAFREVLKINPAASAAQTELSMLQLGAGAPAAAVDSAEAALKAQPDRLDARLALVRGLLASRQFDRAQQELQPLLASYPNVATVQVQNAVLLASRNDLSGARATFEKALAIDRGSLEALAGLLALSMNAKDFAGARARVAQHLQSGPVTPGLLVLAARTFGSAGDLPGAEQALRRAIEMDATTLPAYSMLGEIYLKQGKLDAARSEFENLAQRQSNPVGALTMAGMIFQAQGNPAQAKARYERAVAIDSRAAVASNNLAWLYAEQGEKLEEAVRLARNAAEVLPETTEVLDTLGWTYYKSGLSDVAVAPLVRAIERDPKNAEARYHLGVVYGATGDHARSRESLLQALALDGGASWAADARSKLAILEQKRP
jgi:tetratricopeptide (TPR) repeat protein